MTKTLLLILSVLSINSVVLSQIHRHCQFDSILNKKLKNANYFLASKQFEHNIRTQSSKQSLSSGTIKTIPVVVHIIHQGGVENISDNQVFSQIDVLNKDFRRLNSDTINTNPIFNNVAADLEIQFCLASQDPSGNTTTGIDRVFTMDTTLIYTEFIQMYGWDNNKYMNIYISKNIGSFSSFPSEPDSTDGIFVRHGVFGTTGTAGTELYVEFAKFGRTATHEAGHYLGLYHTFFLGCDTNCTSMGDYVCDTPPADMRWWVFGCLDQSLNSCIESPDLPDQVDNFMDYNIDSCTNMFTNGQKSRIEVTLNQYRSILWSDSNLIETGCLNFSEINESSAINNFKIYPNPMSQQTTLEFDNSRKENHTLTLFNTQGQLVRSITNIKTGSLEIKRINLTNGLYFFQLRTDNHLYAVGKLILQ